jgi:hypothetical protein
MAHPLTLAKKILKESVEVCDVVHTWEKSGISVSPALAAKAIAGHL